MFYSIWYKGILMLFMIARQPEVKREVRIEQAPPEYYSLMTRIASEESGGIIDTINECGHYGKYQMAKVTIQHLGWKVPKRIGNRLDTTNFGNDIQDSLYRVYLRQLETVFLVPCFGKGYSRDAVLYAGGIGFLKVRRYFRSKGKVNQCDGYGITVEKRLKDYDGITVFNNNK